MARPFPLRSRLPLTMSLASVLVLGACGHMPETARNDAPLPGEAPRPHIFGRHAWDAAHAQAVEQARNQTQPQIQASTSASTQASIPAQVVVPLAGPPVVIASTTPPPPPPIASPSVAPPVNALPTPVANPAPPPPPPPPPAPVLEAAAAPPPPPEKPAAKPAKSAADKAPFWAALVPHLSPPPPPPVAGGYEPVTDKPALQAAVAYALHESPGYELKGVYSAKVQVVDGTNYSLCLWVRQIEHEANPLHRRMVAATVYQGLDHHYELTNWHEVHFCHAGT